MARTAAHFLPFPGVGGTEIATVRVIRAAEAHGIRSIAFCLDPTAELLAFLHDSGVAAIAWTPPQPSLRHGAAFFRQSRALAAELRRRHVNLVHCADMRGAQLGSLAGRLAGVPVLCHVRNRHDEITRRDRLFLAPVTHFVFVSRDTWRRFGHRVSESRGSVLYDGIAVPEPAPDRDTLTAALRRELDIPPGAPLIGMSARLSPQKDYETLAGAAARIAQRRPDAVIVVAGDNARDEGHRRHYAHVCELIAARGVSHMFRFTGFRADVHRLLDAFDIYTLSTNWEGLPLAIIEAMAHAKPVVATAVDGIPEIVAEGRTGYLVPHRDPEALARRLLELLDNPARARAMGAAGAARVRDEFSEAVFERRVGELYARFLE